ncbi:prolyl oligopeptidase family serine peptidase [Streptomyces sp. SKN60]|uniref:prolyl oligopeptidase family serine peptidase n=1 Tax=Streptomyces sp. SKN60 TaxID=2855506 RepID=UPI00224653CC|nr:prolyl oligopeptidase family serine peptidase [Streptomyces sp. SKN60]MCX2180445.1 prolyl oligopeptidase family serine peptidase [Streptomyces sp. SKN60]
MSDDPYLWLEEVEGERALDWVRERNAETAAELAGGDGFAGLVAELREVLDAPDRIPYTRRRGPYLYNFWQSAEHTKGVWRRTTLDEYRTDAPAWDVLLDLDALAAEEGEDWTWAGAQVLRPAYRRALVSLARGGGDAVVVREYDLAERAFVADGFTLPEAKTDIGWIDEDHVFVGTDEGPGSLTASGYPRTVRRWRRGTPLDAAELVHEGQESDLVVSAWHDPTEGFERDFVVRYRDFWHHETHLIDDEGELRRLDLPEDADSSVHREWLLVTPKAPWLGQPAGALLAFRFDAFLAGRREPEVLFTPDDRTALAGHSWTRNHLIVETLQDVASRLHVLTPPADPATAGTGTGAGWKRQELADIPPLSSAALTDTDPDTGDEYFLSVTGHLVPPTLHRGEIGGPGETIKQAPERFDADGLEARQYFAVSADGTRVPYTVVGPGDRQGPRPTLLNGYGGFEVSLTPSYDTVRGRAWLARGGTFVVAGIRGGGEYGPRWHRSALKADRPRAYEDFEAVARDLVARGITTPEQLGITGGSNGGLLMGAMLVRSPEMFGAIVAHVPLLDMLRFHRLLAGASWIAEYGDPDDPADRPHLAALSPYHRLAAGRPYPPVLLTTSTRDDRVHPGHARKAAARLRELGHRVLLHETLAGGHAGATDHEQTAYNSALEHTFLWRTLGGRDS